MTSSDCRGLWGPIPLDGESGPWIQKGTYGRPKGTRTHEELNQIISREREREQIKSISTKELNENIAKVFIMTATRASKKLILYLFKQVPMTLCIVAQEM